MSSKPEVSASHGVPKYRNPQFRIRNWFRDKAEIRWSTSFCVFLIRLWKLRCAILVDILSYSSIIHWMYSTVVSQQATSETWSTCICRPANKPSTQPSPMATGIMPGEKRKNEIYWQRQKDRITDTVSSQPPDRHALFPHCVFTCCS